PALCSLPHLLLKRSLSIVVLAYRDSAGLADRVVPKQRRCVLMKFRKGLNLLAVCASLVAFRPGGNVLWRWLHALVLPMKSTPLESVYLARSNVTQNSTLARGLPGGPAHFARGHQFVIHVTKPTCQFLWNPTKICHVSIISHT